MQHPYRKPSSRFNPYRYLDHDDFNTEDTNPLAYALYGIHIPRCPENKDGTEKSEGKQISAENAHGRKPLLFIASHDATRTGAPGIILNIARYLRRSGVFEIVIFMHRGGPLLDEFLSVGDVLCLEEIKQLRDGEEILDRAMKWYCRCKPILAIVNSMESSYFASFFGAVNIPVLMLIHEFVTSYEEELVARVIKNSRKIIFPSQFVKDIAIEKFAIDNADYAVIPQGLLNPAFGSMNVSEARDAVRQELGLPPTAFIVLGCGSLSLRKGPELFVQAAASVKRMYGREDIYFVWVGGGGEDLKFNHYLEWDIDRIGVREQILFAGEKKNVEPYFVGADVFFLSSREDPFPCVVHEAMAASLPVIVFKDTGGAAEAVDDAGIALSFADIPAVSESIFKLYLNSSFRRSYGIMAKQRVHRQYDFGRYCSELADYVKQELGIDLKVDATHLPETDTAIAVPLGPSSGAEDEFYINVETQVRSRKRTMSRPVFIAGPTRSGTSIMKLVLRRIYGDFGAHEGHLWPLYKELHEGIDHYFDQHEEYKAYSTTLFSGRGGRRLPTRSATCSIPSIWTVA